MALNLASLAAALEGSPLGAAMRGGRGWYPAVNVAHLAGLVMLVGAIGVLDLRVIGFGRAIPLAPLSRLLTPIAVAGLVMLGATGFLLFAADAGPLIRSRLFQAKMTVAAAALVNALAFRRLFGDLERGGEPGPLARLMSAGSISAWLVVACLGRLMGYT